MNRAGRLIRGDRLHHWCSASRRRVAQDGADDGLQGASPLCHALLNHRPRGGQLSYELAVVPSHSEELAGGACCAVGRGTSSENHGLNAADTDTGNSRSAKAVNIYEVARNP